jgi:hypothetical protein
MGLLNKLLFGFAAGAGTVYLFDPEHGAQRREALRENALGLLDQQGKNGGALTAQRCRGLLATPLTPKARLWSGVTGALVWVAGSRLRSLRRFKLGTLGMLLLYHTLANDPARAKTQAKSRSTVRRKRAPRKAAARNAESR